VSKTHSVDDSIPAWFIAEGEWLKQAMSDFINSGYEIAKRFAHSVERDADFFDFIIVQYPEIPRGYWRRMLKVGCGHLDFRILSGGVRFGNRVERLPIHEQRRLLDNPVNLLLHNGDILVTSAHKLQAEQLKQVVAYDHIRDVAEQRAYLEDNQMNTVKKRKSVIVSLDGDDFIVDDVSVTSKKVILYIRTMLGA